MERLSAFEYFERLEKARMWAKRIVKFPFVRKVSLTGSMATGMATKQSDIDFFVQVEEGNLWWVRLVITIWVHIAGERRTDSSIANKLCLNWFATFDGPKEQGRRHVVLAGRSSLGVARSKWSNAQCPSLDIQTNSKFQFLSIKVFRYLISEFIWGLGFGAWSFERALMPFSPFLEFIAHNIQRHRFINDPRTHLKNSQVRFSNTELGFHPPKTHTTS